MLRLDWTGVITPAGLNINRAIVPILKISKVLIASNECELLYKCQFSADYRQMTIKV